MFSFIHCEQRGRVPPFSTRVTSPIIWKVGGKKATNIVVKEKVEKDNLSVKMYSKEKRQEKGRQRRREEKEKGTDINRREKGTGGEKDEKVKKVEAGRQERKSMFCLKDGNQSGWKTHGPMNGKH